MTTREPGASDVLTHERVSSPASTAFFASRPAASITDGLDVFVQEVIAAITTEPCFTMSPSTDIGVSAPGSVVASVSTSTSTFPPSSSNLPTSLGRGSGSTWSRKAARNDAQTSARGTRSCGRFGPATEGSIAARSSSTTSEKRGSGSPSARNNPCSFVYRSTRSTRSPRPVKVR